jgi:hypothetical protein
VIERELEYALIKIERGERLQRAQMSGTLVITSKRSLPQMKTLSVIITTREYFS